MTRTYECREFHELPTHVQASTRNFIDRAGSASPFQDPIFIGDGCFGAGIDHKVVVIESNSRAVFFAHCVFNYAASRYLPGLRNVYVSKGPIAQDAEALTAGLAALVDMSRRERVIVMHIAPQLVTDEASWFEGLMTLLNWRNDGDANQMMTLRLDLSPTLDELIARFHKTTRYEIRRAARSGVIARRAQTERDFSAFYDVYARRGREKGFSTASAALFENLRGRVTAAKDRGALFLSELKGRIVGGAVVLRSGPRAHYVYGASDVDAAPGLPIAYPPIWQALEWAKEIGCREFDFGGFGPQGDVGVGHFKKGFGGKLVTFVRPQKRLLRSGAALIVQATRRFAN